MKYFEKKIYGIYGITLSLQFKGRLVIYKIKSINGAAGEGLWKNGISLRMLLKAVCVIADFIDY